MTTATAQIAQHLNIVESLIAEVQEWAHVLFVKFVSGRPRFVSKKVAMNMEGTEKQVKWALDLQAQVVDSLERLKPIAKSDLARYQKRVAKATGKSLDKLMVRVEELQRFLKVVDQRIQAVKNCKSAKAFIETRPNPSNGAERQWGRLVQETEGVLSGDQSIIHILSQPQYAISRLGGYEAEVLGYNLQEYEQHMQTVRSEPHHQTHPRPR